MEDLDLTATVNPTTVETKRVKDRWKRLWATAEASGRLEEDLERAALPPDTLPDVVKYLCHLVGLPRKHPS